MEIHWSSPLTITLVLFICTPDLMLLFSMLSLHSLSLLIRSSLPTALAWEVMRSPPSACPSICFHSTFGTDRPLTLNFCTWVASTKCHKLSIPWAFQEKNLWWHFVWSYLFSGSCNYPNFSFSAKNVNRQFLKFFDGCNVTCQVQFRSLQVTCLIEPQTDNTAMFALQCRNITRKELVTI